eukprot:TRINITY_DN12364_c1_g7_i7.p3 TRINITY_DN12364_c1_g7~~TRINITY_DN12364_c1_g7_i7.p3  ORF type:complete len:118 (-),score=13.10 TRINITY_DN12364_c1_g7_i7:735-1088(-)
MHFAQTHLNELKKDDQVAVTNTKSQYNVMATRRSARVQAYVQAVHAGSLLHVQGALTGQLLKHGLHGFSMLARMDGRAGKAQVRVLLSRHSLANMVLAEIALPLITLSVSSCGEQGL